MPAQPDRVFAEHLERLRRWGILATLSAYRGVDVDDLDASLALVGQQMAAIYGAAVINALDSTDEYMNIAAAIAGLPYGANWRNGRPEAPLQLFGGTPFGQWMANASPAIKRLIALGMDPAQAVEISQARAAQQVASSPLQLARSTTWKRFLVDATLSELGIAPQSLTDWVDEVEVYANLSNEASVRDYQGTWQRWQRVPSPGACGFCLMLATRTNYTSADAAMYAGGSSARRRTSSMESGERYHRSCRCTVRAVAQGGPAAISSQDYQRLTTRDANGNLPAFFESGRYRYTAAMFTFDPVAIGVPMPPIAAWQNATR